MTNSESEIEKYQAELIEYLISIIPVPWKKIVFYAESTQHTSSLRFGFTEKDTNVIVTMDFFFDRYNYYAFSKIDVFVTLYDILEKIYNAYLEILKDEIWNTISYIIESPNDFTIEFGNDKKSERVFFEEAEWFVKKFFYTNYIWVKGKYPAKE